MDATSIIHALGGTTKLAGEIKAGRSAVANWHRAGIPARYWPRIARLAAQQDATKHITLNVLEKHGCRQNADAAPASPAPRSPSAQSPACLADPSLPAAHPIRPDTTDHGASAWTDQRDRAPGSA